MDTAARRSPRFARGSVSSLCRYLTRWREGRATEIVAQVAGLVVIALVPEAFAVWIAYQVASALRTRELRLRGEAPGSRNLSALQAVLSACYEADKPLDLVNVMRKRSIYVVYPAALFDGWEVVKEHSDNPAIFKTREQATSYAKAQAVMDGGGVVKLESWFGDTESVWEAEEPQAYRPLALSTS